MSTSKEILQRAIELIEHLPKEILPEALAILESLSVKNSTESNTQESKLLETIQYCFSTEDKTRLDYLREQNEWGNLIESEYNELLSYEERLENINVERVKALMELAKLRNTDISTLNNQFKSEYLK